MGSKILTFVRKRTSRESPYGHTFTVGVLLSLLFFFFFLSIGEDVLTHDPFVEADTRIANLIYVVRNINFARVMLFFTCLGDAQIVFSLGAVTMIALWLWGKRRNAKFFLATVFLAEVLLSLVKFLTQRTRPDPRLALIIQNGYAFPSGHATLSIVFYGLLGYFLWTHFRKKWQKTLIAFSALLCTFLIGYSRIYLGAHWTSDVLAGWFLGLSIFLLSVALLRELNRARPETYPVDFLAKILIRNVVAIMLFIELGFVMYYYFSHPIIIPDPLPSNTQTVFLSENDLLAAIKSPLFPKFSEGLTAKKMEPASFIVVGSKESLTRAFEDAGWYVADPPTTTSLFWLARSVIFNKQYNTAPVTPAFMNAKPETIAFEKPTSRETSRERHHARFWVSGFEYGTSTIWAGTASLDEGIRFLVTHRINPNIDVERDFIKTDLERSGLVKQIILFQLVPPLYGKNEGGDNFYTNGKTYLVFL